MERSVDPDIADGGEVPAKRVKQPNKAFYRSRAHCNPLAYNDAFDYPSRPDDFSWSSIYPNIDNRQVAFLDVGCGFGGLTMALARLFPDKLVLGMEIRAKVTEYVKKRIEASREESPGQFQNAGVLRTNSMRYMPNYIRKEQLEKIFFCFPDPHFKAKNHRRRIVSDSLLTEYAYFLRPDGRLYTITDVEELHKWHVEKCEAHPFFRRIADEEAIQDPATNAMLVETEEGQKVARMGGHKYFAVFVRIPNHELPEPLLLSL